MISTVNCRCSPLGIRVFLAQEDTSRVVVGAPGVEPDDVVLLQRIATGHVTEQDLVVGRVCVCACSRW